MFKDQLDNRNYRIFTFCTIFYAIF